MLKYIYVVEAGGHYKIGISTNVLDRIRTIQTGNASLISLIMAAPVIDAQRQEAELHKWLADHRAVGEWFELAPKQVIELVSKITLLSQPELNHHLTLRNLLYRQEMVEKKVAKIYERVNQKLEAVQMKPIPVKEQLVDELLLEAIEIAEEHGSCSASMLQRRLRVGYARAARILEQLEERGIVSPADGARRREYIRA